MDPFVNETDHRLLAGDRFTFSVLDRILREKCEWILSNHRDLILCHSAAPYPVWIWTADGCPESVKDEAWTAIEANRPFEDGFRCNLKQELADHFIAKAKHVGLALAVSMKLLTYECPEPHPPVKPANGGLCRCSPSDTDVAADFHARFYAAIGEKDRPRAFHAEKVAESLENGALYFWKNAEGEPVACCTWRPNGGLASIGSVFTLPEHRRKHYAQNLVYRVTKLVRDKGFSPILYTDANYPASNACYAGIGYVLRGGLCTVSLPETKS